MDSMMDGSYHNKTQDAKNDNKEEVLKKCREYFWDMDTNGDGMLNKGEFSKMISHIGVTLDASDLKRVYARADVDGSGTISFKEFLDAYASEKPTTRVKGNGKKLSTASNISTATTTRTGVALTEEEIRNGCRYFWESDTDCDGKLHIVEFSNMLIALDMELNQRDVSKAFRVADVDGDGFISFGEFVRAYLNEIKPNSLTSDKIKDIYKKNDKQHKGFITTEEFQQAMKMLGNNVDEVASKKLMKIANKNDIGKLNLTDFCTFLGLESDSVGEGVGRGARRRSRRDTSEKDKGHVGIRV